MAPVELSLTYRVPGYAVGLCLLLSLSACGWGPGAKIKEPVLTGAMIESLIPGNTLQLTTPDQSALTIYYHKNGQAYLRGRSANGVIYRDNGLWSVESDRLCTRWRDIRGGRKVCEWVTTQDTSISFYEPQGDFSATGTVAAGDPYRLQGTR